MALLPCGTPIAVKTARHLLKALPGSLAVVRAEDEAITALLEAQGMCCVVCDDAHEGMGRSIAAGVKASANAKGWLIALSDMPYVKPRTYQQILRALERGASIVAPVYNGKRGNPVGFSARFRGELIQLTGDKGGRFLLHEHASDVELTPVQDCAIHQDIDSPGDLGQLM